jgi:hypothetical protein
MINKFKVGDYVRCNYRARWIGVVTGTYWIQKGMQDGHWGLTVKQLISRTGHRLPKNLQRTVNYSAVYFELLNIKIEN